MEATNNTAARMEDGRAEEEAPKAAPVHRKCALCALKKPLAAGCGNNACKKCCLARSDDCAVHQRARKSELKAAQLESVPAEAAKPKKPVFKHEFKETNFAYYGETVTVFCVRDFFAAKKLSQGILNDQTRSQRVGGTYVGKQPRKHKGVKSPELKAAILDVLGKRKRPASEDAVASPGPSAVAAAN